MRPDTEDTLAIRASMLVLFTAMLHPVISAGLAVVLLPRLGGSGSWSTRTGSDRPLAQPPRFPLSRAQPGSSSASGISKVARIGTSGMKTTTIAATIAAAIPTQKLDAIAIDTES